MPTPAEILESSAAFLNDQGRAIFTNTNMLAYFNQALRDLQEQYELNDVPVTYGESTVLNVPLAAAGTIVKIAFEGTTPILPDGLVEIKEIFTSATGQNNWIPVDRRPFLPSYNNSQINQFLAWSWQDNEIHLIGANQNNDLKINYIKSLFNAVPLTAIDVNLGVKFNSLFSFLAYRTAALCSYYIGENPDRAIALNNDAGTALSTAIGISTKGKQGISIRRLPFRFGFKARGYSLGR